MSRRQYQNSDPREIGEASNHAPTIDQRADLSASCIKGLTFDPLWTPEQVAERLNVSPDWVRDHSSRKEPRLPVIRLGGGPGRAGLLRYRASEIEKFLDETERLSRRNSRRGL